jgi:hypothetical protein
MRPEDGLVIAGAPAGSLQLAGAAGDISAHFAGPEITMGGEAFQLSLLARLVSVTKVAAAAVEAAVSAAARAENAPRAGVVVLARAVDAKTAYCERVFPPQLARGPVEEARRAVYEAAARCLGWSSGERRAAAKQASLDPEDGGLGLGRPVSAAPFLASWWGAQAAQEEAGPAATVCAAAADASCSGAVVRAAYASCVEEDPGLPPTLDGLAARVEEAEADPRLWRTSARDEFRWQAFLTAGRRAAHVRAWADGAPAAAKHRVALMGGSWVFGDEDELRGVPAGRDTYACAMRLRFGLAVPPGCHVAAEAHCAHVKRNGVRCAVALDATGHHAAACGAGGGFVRRHNGVVWALAAALRSMGLAVRTEVWVEDLAEVHEGQVREARMDIVIQTPGARYYLDVTVFHPFTRVGARRTHAAGGTLLAQETRKRTRYVTREPVSGRRLTTARFVPVAVSTFGKVGDAAQELFVALEQAARRDKLRFRARRLGWLARTVSAAAVNGAARGVLDAFAPPDGQERAHLRGVAAA